MTLDQEQIEIFIKFIDTFKDVIRDKRHKFLAHHDFDANTIITHIMKEGLRFQLFRIDFDALLKAKLFDGYYTNSTSSLFFIINPDGILFYEQSKNERLLPLERIEKTVVDYISSSYFVERYPKAYKKWFEAESLFIKETSTKNLTTIGHLCREAMQEYSDELLSNKALANTFEKSKIIMKVKHVFENHKSVKSDTTEMFLDSLLNYWGNISDLVQKQEHDSQKEGNPLNIEDARRIVFHTAIVMYEIDKTVL